MRKFKKLNPRYIALSLILIAIMLLYSVRMVQIQLIDADYYVSQADSVSTRSVSIQAARGEILDRYGRPLAVNREGYDIVFNRAYLSPENMNNTIRVLVNLLSKSGEEWFDNLPMEKTAPYNFTGDEAAVSRMKTRIGVAHYATADNCYSQMVTSYQLEGLESSLQRTIMGVRYSMDLADFSIANPYTFAEDVSTETMTKIVESGFDLPGVEIEVVPIREYPDTSVAPNILGTMGPIYAEDWEKLKAEGYSYNDKVGKSGIEGYAESNLRGTDGKRTVSTDAQGNLLSSQVETEPTPGNTVVLELDKKLQKVAQTQLAELVNKLRGSNGEANAGACVAINVKTGGVLASANYPTYTLDEYMNDYSKLVNDENRPLFDRAFNGLYPPGSSFKPLVSIAGLNEGIIDKDTYITCTHVYHYYDYNPTCLGYHGSINVVTALSKSCNYFFYDVGKNLGIETIDKYCRQLGLGVLTGVEISESTGIIAGPAYRESIGSTWMGGDTIQAAIGQSDNSFTPLQLATCTATIANGGTRYQSKLIHEIKSYDFSETIVNASPTVLNTLQLKDGVIETVKEGMLSVTEDGTGSATFGNYAIKVGGKTGTAETSKGDNSVFIAFAPYEDPEIAVAVIIENGGYGSGSGTLVKAIFDAYFFSEEEYADTQYGTLLQ